MLLKKIKYKDYDEKDREEEFRFNLTQAEVMEMELSVNGGLVNMLNHVVAAQDGSEMMRIFKEIILKSYGEKSPDGKRFIKSKEISEAFSQTEAYNTLFVELATNPDALAEFINGIVPAPLPEPAKSNHQ